MAKKSEKGVAMSRYPVRISEETKRELQYLKLDLGARSVEQLAGELLAWAVRMKRAEIEHRKPK